MLPVSTANHNGVPYPACPSDYETTSAPPYSPVPKVPAPLPVTVCLTLNMAWAGGDGVQYSATARGDDIPEVLAIVRTIQTLRQASNARREKSKAQAPEPEPDANTQVCKVHNIAMAKAISRKTGRPYFSHMMGDAKCFGRGTS